MLNGSGIRDNMLDNFGKELTDDIFEAAIRKIRENGELFTKLFQL